MPRSIEFERYLARLPKAEREAIAKAEREYLEQRRGAVHSWERLASEQMRGYTEKPEESNE